MPAARIRNMRSSRRCHSSGSTRSASSIERATSANKTVTTLRSPRSALWDARIFSTRCRGVEEGGSRVIGGAARGAPHPLQKRAPAGFSWPQDWQVTGILADLAGAAQLNGDGAPRATGTWARWCRMAPMGKKLTPAQIERYHHDGFVYPIEAFAAEDVRRYRRAL